MHATLQKKCLSEDTVCWVAFLTWIVHAKFFLMDYLPSRRRSNHPGCQLLLHCIGLMRVEFAWFVSTSPNCAWSRKQLSSPQENLIQARILLIALTVSCWRNRNEGGKMAFPPLPSLPTDLLTSLFTFIWQLSWPLRDQTQMPTNLLTWILSPLSELADAASMAKRDAKAIIGALICDSSHTDCLWSNYACLIKFFSPCTWQFFEPDLS